MRRRIIFTIALVGFALFHSPLLAQPVCKLESLPQLTDVTITSVTQETQYAPHCKVAGVIGPEIRFELLLPENWNGKFVFGGGGGFVGSVVNLAQSLYGAVHSGYATVGTDTGHQAHSLDASWALNNMERIVNFGHQAVHRTTVTARALIKAYYQQDIASNYFIGCSRGGGQALMEAQRYPDDFDGIVAGAPAYNWTMGLGAGTTQIMQAMYPDPNNLQEAVIGPKELKLIESAYLDECDALDGIEDGILNDPRQCQFDVATLLCKGKKTDSCLTKAHLTAVKAVYEGPKDKQGKLFYGFPFGGETDAGGWSMWVAGGLKYQANRGEFQEGLGSDFPAPVTPAAHYSFGNGVMKYLIYHDPDWNYATHEYDTFREDAKLAGNTLNATNPDLSAFRKKGGKLLMYTGWSDVAITALGTIGYYEDVVAHDKTAANDVRLFMMPGVGHCFGGKGPSWVNYLTEIDKWVETGKAPDQITAYFVDEKMQPTGSRLMCAYPQTAEYDGKGDPREVSSFSCDNDN
jgi:feruloyl esterase